MGKRAESLGQTGKKEVFCVPLDSILDTRLGTIARMDTTVAQTLLDNGWRTRMQDKFEGVDMEAYRELYEKRDQVTLSMSFETGILKMLRGMMFDLRKQAVKRPYHDGGVVIVNYWPYKLTADEIKAYQLQIFAGLGKQADVFMRSWSPKEFTPKMVKKNFSCVVMYDWDAWLSLHVRAFEKVRCAEVSMFAPAIYFTDELPGETEMAKCKAEGVHPLKASEAAASALIELNLLDVLYFSAVEKPE